MKLILAGLLLVFSAPITVAHAVAPCKAAQRARELSLATTPKQAALNKVARFDAQPAKDTQRTNARR